MPNTTPILDPRRELPSPHDMQLPITHWQKLSKPTFFSHYKWIILCLAFLFLTLVTYGILNYLGLYIKPVQTWKHGSLTYLSTPTPTVPETEWKTYTNQYFSISYPAIWQTKDTTKDIRVFPLNSKTQLDVEHSVFFMEQDAEHSGFTVDVLKNPEQYTLDQISSIFSVPLLADPSKNLAKFTKDILVNGNPAKYYSIFAFDRNTAGIFTVDKNYIYYISFDDSNPNDPEFETNKKIYDSMLSSFRFPLTPTAQLSQDALITINAEGGLCPYGPCKSVTAFQRDGILMKDSVKKGRLTEMELIHLNSLMNSANFTEIRSKKFTGTCPTEYDGTEQIYTFYKEVVTEKVESCETAIDENHVLFKTINELLIKYK